MINYQLLSGHKVFLRADLNVPFNNGIIIDDYRLQAIVPTIDYIQKNNGMVILATHIGRPNNYDATLSTKNLVAWFNEHGYCVEYVPDFASVKQILFDAKKIILLENLRFYPQEQKPSKEFAQQLAELADFYINDAFATMHRHDSSITLLADCFDRDHKDVGLLVKKELAMLVTLLAQPKENFIGVIGGGKVTSKLPLLEKLITITSTIMVCPALCFTFMKANANQNVGKSLVDYESIELIAQLIEQASLNHCNLLLPVDYYCALNTSAGPLIIVDTDKIPGNAIGISIGPKTIDLWRPLIESAKTILVNAGMGFMPYPKTFKYTLDLFKTIAHSPAFTVLGGGESVAIARTIRLDTDFDFVSTGGGAMVSYISGLPLPGLMAMRR